ncbi:MAG TPA: cbb3-type cytochrome c oxidase subunit I [Chlamydiales bacterium]|jgi:cytochrome o ubiquinol oxidase subunit 1|nr:cbb3-type cytochrome c oxidase subunit I [Chlamydiales bacterium]
MIQTSSLFGRLTLEAFKRDAIETSVGVSILIAGALIFGFLTYYKRWRWLWFDWLTTVDHKKIAVMYFIVSGAMLFKGFVDALMMRAQQFLSVGDGFGYLTSEHFQQLFTAHGVTMIFFVAMGLVSAFFNYIVPLQIGARDVAFPFVNALSFWFFTAGAILLIVSLNIGYFSGAGWVAYPPLSSLDYNPGVGVDYWIWSVQISGVGTLLTGINFLVTILKMRCPGMTLMRMPLFTWTAFVTLILIIFAFPILTATVGMLTLDRLFDTQFFSASNGGNPMMYINLIWAWGHPEVYILVLPAFGIYSEAVAVFSQKRLFGYVSMVWAIIAIAFLSFIVWLHHFFTMGAGPNVNAFFGFMTMIIAVPTGVKIFNWLFTMLKGKIIFNQAMLWFIGFVVIFTIGGADGVLMSVAPVDFQLHNSLFLIAHFHSVIIGGVVFGFFVGLYYWFPKIFGFKLNEKLGEYAVFCWILGFLLAFIPLYILGLMGATRRLDHYELSTGWWPLFAVAALGVLIIALGIGFQVLQLFVSFKQRKENRDVTGNPWNGATLEWSTSSPPPVYNFATIPQVHSRDPLWHQKEPLKSSAYEIIHMPKNTPLGLYAGVLSFFFGFAVVWYIFWLALVSLIGILACILIRLWDRHTETFLSPEEIARIESETRRV